MKRTEDKERNHKEARERIKVAAYRVLKEDADGFTIAKVAKVAVMSKPAVYYYFKDASDLMRELAIDIESDELAIIHTAFDRGPAAVFEARAMFYFEEPTRFHVLHELNPDLGGRLESLRVGDIGIALDLALGVIAAGTGIERVRVYARTLRETAVFIAGHEKESYA